MTYTSCIVQSICGAIVFLCIVLSAEKTVCTEESSESESPPSVLNVSCFCGERLAYDMGFWLFRYAAEGLLTFSCRPHGYEALFEAETKGLIKIIAGHRKETMRSIMEFDNASQRLRPVFFQEVFTSNGREVDKSLTFNYPDNSYRVSVEVDNQCILYRTKTLPAGEFEDLFTFFYNLRMGHYGSVLPGRSLKICLVMTERPSFLKLVFNEKAPGRAGKTRYNAVLHMEKRLTQARSNRVACRFSEDLIPLYAVVKDAYYFGDLTVRLSNYCDGGDP